MHTLPLTLILCSHMHALLLTLILCSHICTLPLTLTIVPPIGWYQLITKWITLHSISVWRDMRTAVNALVNNRHRHDDLQWKITNNCRRYFVHSKWPLISRNICNNFKLFRNNYELKKSSLTLQLLVLQIIINDINVYSVTLTTLI